MNGIQFFLGKNNMSKFGAKLAKLRKSAGYTQLELANEVGISRRMIAHYEGQTNPPPATLLSKLATALGTSIEVLLGMPPVNKSSKVSNSRLQRRLQQIEKMESKEKRQVLQLIDAFIEREQLKKKVGV